MSVETTIYPELKQKEFASKIPPHLLDKLTPGERYFVEAISKLEAQFDWTRDAVLVNNRSILDLDKRASKVEKDHQTLDSLKAYVDKVDKLWEWKTLMSGKWGVIAAIALVVLPILLKALLDYIIKRP